MIHNICVKFMCAGFPYLLQLHIFSQQSWLHRLLTALSRQAVAFSWTAATVACCSLPETSQSQAPAICVASSRGSALEPSTCSLVDSTLEWLAVLTKSWGMWERPADGIIHSMPVPMRGAVGVTPPMTVMVHGGRHRTWQLGGGSQRVFSMTSDGRLWRLTNRGEVSLWLTHGAVIVLIIL